MTVAKDRQINIKLNPEQYAVLKAIADRQEYKTTPQGVAASHVRKWLDTQDQPPVTKRTRKRAHVS